MMKAFHGLIAAACVLAFATGVQAQGVTPSHVYQAADDVATELTLLLDANFSDAAEPAAPSVAGKRPRHVVQKARQILAKVQLLQRINGVPVREMDPIAVREIAAADVKGWVDRVLTEVRRLKSVYGVDAAPEPASLTNGKTPSDVYARLDQVETMVDRLDLPAIVPNDVYRVALMVIADLRLVADKLGIVANVDWEGWTAKGKLPPHIHAKARAVLVDLKAFVESHDAVAIKGGVVIPPAMTKNVTPDDVVEVSNAILAELSSLKTHVGATQPTKVFPPQSAKTPSDSFVALEAAQEYLSTISTVLAARG